MRVVRGVWRLLVGVKDGLVLLFMLLFFGLLYAALTVRPNVAAIGNGALLLKLDGSIVEQPTPIEPRLLAAGGSAPRQFRLRDLVAAIRAAGADSRVKAVVLDLDGFTGGGQVALGDVGEALDTVRRSGKPVLAFATGYSDDAYALAAHAGEIWLEPMGAALFTGQGGSRLYYKGLIDRLGVNAHVYRVGQFKSAVEPFTRTDQSPEARAANEALASALWTDWQRTVSAARPKAQLAAYVANPQAAVVRGNLAQAALSAGIVDRLGTREAFEKRLASIAGAGDAETAFATIKLPAYAAANPPPSGSGSIGIVTVAGNIVDGEADAGTAGGDTIAKIIEDALKTGRFKALVLRVDSPGGSALASERIRVALGEAKRRGLPIVVSMANVAASGGYWVAMAGDRVYAEPATITGSIGVFGVIPTFEAALAKIGVTSDGVATTPLSGQPDIVGGTNAAFDTIVQRSVEDIYGRFIGLVAGARNLPPARVNAIGQGRVWDGGSARQLGLVDAFGGLDDAVAEAARRAKLDTAQPHAVWLEKPPSWNQVLGQLLAASEQPEEQANDAISTLARARTLALAQAIDDAAALATGAAIQARCLECPVTIVPTRAPRLLDTLLAWARW